MRNIFLIELTTATAFRLSLPGKEHRNFCSSISAPHPANDMLYYLESGGRFDRSRTDTTFDDINLCSLLVVVSDLNLLMAV